MQNLTLFKTLTIKQLKAGTDKYTGNKAQQDFELFNTWIANKVYKYFETNDATHLNHVISGAKSRGVYRDYIGYAKSISAHNYSGGEFVGKMNRDKMDISCNLTNNDTLQFEQGLFDLLGRLSQKAVDKEAGVTAPLTAPQKEARFRNLFLSMGKEGMSLDDMDKAYFAMRSEFEVSHLKAVA